MAYTHQYPKKLCIPTKIQCKMTPKTPEKYVVGHHIYRKPEAETVNDFKCLYIQDSDIDEMQLYLDLRQCSKLCKEIKMSVFL